LVANSDSHAELATCPAPKYVVAGLPLCVEWLPIKSIKYRAATMIEDDRTIGQRAVVDGAAKNAIDKILAGRKDCQPVELQIAVLFEAGDLFQIALI
jgi:hypothetical protein